MKTVPPEHPLEALATATFAYAAELLPAVVWRARPDGQIDYVNSRWAAETGLPLEDALGARWLLAVRPSERAQVQVRWLAGIDRGQAFGFDVPLRTPAGTYQRCRLMAHPEDGPDGFPRWHGLFFPVQAADRLTGDGAAAAVTVAPQAPPVGPLRILLVEDIPETQLLIRHILQPYCTITCTDRVEEAIALARSEPFEIVLLDINLRQQYDGVDLMRFIRALPGYTDVPLVAVTAYSLPGDRERLLESGFDDYLAKPFTTKDLNLLVRRLAPRPTKKSA